MKRNSVEFIYHALNAIASGKHDPETEKCLSDAVEEEILAINANLVVERWCKVTAATPLLEAHAA